MNQKQGVVGVARRDDLWLMIQRSDHVIAPRKWCFPGGGVESGESASEAVVRELREELSLETEAIERVWDWTRGDGLLSLEWWMVRIVGGTPTPDPAEVRDFRWMTSSEIRVQPDVLANNILFLDHFERNGNDAQV